jgi:hypothetical protein
MKCEVKIKLELTLDAACKPATREDILAEVEAMMDSAFDGEELNAGLEGDSTYAIAVLEVKIDE